ncbi:unnamed protein product [Brassica oleracea var. botrytis]|uniref:(rape) hypothetical protein n=1 Tax=Brassica napus TaxID=3708 RepID=A0A078J4A4_BRANA|nr:unnamed protein product [Brassica napus]CDY57279.1 BnaC06g41170D [Brassica napus]
MFHTTASVSIRLTQRGTLCSSPLSNSEWTQDEGHQIVGCVLPKLVWLNGQKLRS